MLRLYTFGVFYFQVEKEQLRKKYWICISCDGSVLKEIQQHQTLIERETLELYEGGRNFHRKYIKILHDKANAESLILPCKSDFYQTPFSQHHKDIDVNTFRFMCWPSRKLAFLIAIKLNA